ncbi:MAG: twin-arginine translocase TatA/TatE family subunit [Anaerolineales bacterium]|nr:MAG: twin-arginine translocase TatA/TatE family subunit [Anaerolineales bacterium]
MTEVLMRFPGGWEWIIILIVVLLIFGPGRLSKIAGEIGRGIREFRSGIQGDDDEQSPTDVSESQEGDK